MFRHLPFRHLRCHLEMHQWGVGFKKDCSYSVGDAHLTSQAGDNFPVAQTTHDQGGKHQKLEVAGAAVEMDVKYHASNLSRRGIEEACNQIHGEPVTRSIPECAVEAAKQQATAMPSSAGDWNPPNEQVPNGANYAMDKATSGN